MDFNVNFIKVTVKTAINFKIIVITISNHIFLNYKTLLKPNFWLFIMNSILFFLSESYLDLIKLYYFFQIYFENYFIGLWFLKDFYKCLENYNCFMFEANQYAKLIKC